MGNVYVTHVRYCILKNLLKHLLSFYRQKKCKGKFIFVVSGLAVQWCIWYLVQEEDGGGGGGGSEASGGLIGF